MQPQPQSWNDLPLRQRIEIMQWLCTFPALTVMVFLRRNLGYRLLSPLSLCVVAAVMFLISTFAQHTPNPEGLQIFALLVLFVGASQRWSRWKEIRRGVRLHTYYIGDSCLEFRWLPGFIRRNRRIPRFFDPLFCFAIGALLFMVSPALGGWIVFSGFCLRTFEDAVYRKELERDLDTLDGLIASEVQAEAVEHFSEAPKEERRHADLSTGIPTGLAPDVEEVIARKRARKMRQPRPQRTNDGQERE